MNNPLIFAVYTLGALTIAAFLTFVVLLVRYFKAIPKATITPPTAAPGTDQLHGLDPSKVFDSLGKVIEMTAKLANALKDAKPVAIAALLTILFLMGWLFSLTLLIVSTIH